MELILIFPREAGTSIKLMPESSILVKNQLTKTGCQHFLPGARPLSLLGVDTRNAQGNASSSSALSRLLGVFVRRSWCLVLHSAGQNGMRAEALHSGTKGWAVEMCVSFVCVYAQTHVDNENDDDVDDSDSDG